MLIEGKEVPDSEVIAGYVAGAQAKAEAEQLRTAQAAANAKLQQAEAAVQAIERARTDPAFARNMVDTLAQVHGESAFFKGEVLPPAPQGAPTPEGGAVLPPAAPAPGTPVPPPSPTGVDLELARTVEVLQRRLDQNDAQALLDAKLLAIGQRFPAVDTEKLVERCLAERIPLEHLELLASDVERERLQAELGKRETNNSLLDQLLSAGGAADVDSNLDAIGSSLSAGQLKGDAGVDYETMSTEDAVALAFATVGAATDSKI